MATADSWPESPPNRGTAPARPEFQWPEAVRDDPPAVTSKAAGSDSRSLPKVFAYGTLRGDYGMQKDGRDYGDKWRVVEDGASWRRGRVCGYKLFQDLNRFYPFAVQTNCADDVLVGTLLEWPSQTEAEDGITRCNGIEGFNPDNPEDGLYMRSTVEVVLDPRHGSHEPERALAYIYHQQEQSGSHIVSFPDGDWFSKEVANMGVINSRTSFSMKGPTGDELVPTFGFGSNSIRQLRGRLNAPDLVGYPAKVPGQALAFAGPNASWSHLSPPGGTATLIPCPGEVALGTMCFLSQEQLLILDGCEGVPRVYNRQYFDAEVTIDGSCHQVQALAYIKVDQEWYSPTEAYCCAVLYNVGSSWPEVTELTLRDTSGEQRDSFAHPGFQNLTLPALLFEVAVRKAEPWVLPRGIRAPAVALSELGLRRGVDVRQLLLDGGLAGGASVHLEAEDLAILRQLLDVTS